MHRRHLISIIKRVIIGVHGIVYQAQCVTSECWTTSSGKEVCSSDPTGLRATWWFFFVLLLFASVASGCFDADWWPQEQTTQDHQATRLESGLLNDAKGLSESMVHPLLGGHEVQQQLIPPPPKPVYRYLDP
ncbi:hypothetical protein DVH05_004097 [Phytophthora capsici]|nr:hypothetical protein DVH05_004097 [Phytophthora capsici]